MAECIPSPPAETMEIFTESISLREDRPFAGRIQYLNDDDYKFAMTALKEAAPKTPSAYRTSGRTTLTAMLLLPLAALFMAILVVVLGFLARYEMHRLPVYEYESVNPYATSPPKIAGIYALVFDLLLAFLVLYLPVKSLTWLGRLLKNRNATFATVLAGLAALVPGVVLFYPLPWLEGNTVAFSRVVLNGIPIQWLIILGGSVLLPAGAAFWTYRIVHNMKFCEQTGVFLKRLRQLRFDIDFVENALALLKEGRFEDLSRLPAVQNKKYKKHCVQAELWGHAQAATAYLELKVLLDVRIGRKTERSEKWLAFSSPLDADRARALMTVYPERQEWT